MINNKMKIWVIGRNYPTTRNKMCGSFELEQARILAKNGHIVSYIACPFHPLYKVKKWGAVDWQDGCLHVYAYSQVYFPQRMNVYWDSFKSVVWKKLLNRVEAEQGTPDVIHLHYPTMISVPEAILTFHGKGTKIIATEHWSNVLTGKLTSHAKRQLKTYVESVDHFICVGQPLKDSVLRITKTQKRVEVVPNMVPDVFECGYQVHDGVKFISVGRLVKGKQFDKLIIAFANVFANQSDVSLTIVGGGGQYRMLRKMVKRMGLDSQVFFTGTIDRSSVAQLMRESDVLVLYSRSETFGVPVIEGWFAGIPAIATTGIGFAEYWKESLGEIVPIDDCELLEKAMRTVKDRIKNGYYSKKDIRDFAKASFSENAIYMRLIELYNS